MLKILKVTLAGALALATVIASAPESFAREGRHHYRSNVEERCVPRGGDLAGPLFIGLLLGAVTGGVGTAVAFAGASVATGAAIGAAGGAVIGVTADGHSRYYC